MNEIKVGQKYRRKHVGSNFYWGKVGAVVRYTSGARDTLVKYQDGSEQWYSLDSFFTFFEPLEEPKMNTMEELLADLNSKVEVFNKEAEKLCAAVESVNSAQEARDRALMEVSAAKKALKDAIEKM